MLVSVSWCTPCAVAFCAEFFVCAYLLDIVVGKSSAVFELLAGENQSLLVGWDALFVLDLALDIVDGVRRLHLKGDGLAR